MWYYHLLKSLLPSGTAATYHCERSAAISKFSPLIYWGFYSTIYWVINALALI
jgi:hypothetical protein